MYTARNVRRVGVIGYPIRHTISPAFQQAALDFHGIPARYEAWEIPPEALVEFVAGLRCAEALGANVTVPHKQAVLALVDEVDGLAKRIGAVNTIVNHDGRLLGHNTDAFGFLKALESEAGYEVAEKRALVLGAGGAARAVAFALLDAGVASLLIVNRNSDRAATLAMQLRALAKSNVSSLGFDDRALAEAVANSDLLINATPAGMRHSADERVCPIPARLLRRGHLVYDLVYNPLQTPLLLAAAKVGATTLNGLPMLVHQGVASFELWTGKPAPLGLMFERARAALPV